MLNSQEVLENHLCYLKIQARYYKIVPLDRYLSNQVLGLELGEDLRLADSNSIRCYNSNFLCLVEDYQKLEPQSYFYFQTSHLSPAHLKPIQVLISMSAVCFEQEDFVIKIHYLFPTQQTIVSSHVPLSVLLV